MLVLLLFLVPLGQPAPVLNNSADLSPAFAATNFHPDCADPHNKEVACTVHQAPCDLEPLPLTEKGHEPPEPHDFRIEAFSKATARGKNAHQLHVDLSWQMPPKNESSNLKAFRLEILDEDNTKVCFHFNVSKFGFNEESASPRFHFTSDSLFDFSKTYTAKLSSLPKSKNKEPSVVRQKTMPTNMESEHDSDNITKYCETHSHPEASKWTAGFRRIFLQSASKMIQLEFVGAPPQFCFEEYEVRLLDETGIELLFHTIIKASDMKREFIDGKWISFGEYNFTGLELETDYIPSVIPVDTASDGRCLCPTSEQHGACSCIAADWKKVRLHKLDKPAVVANSTSPAVVSEPRQEGEFLTLTYVIFGILLILLLIALAAFVVICCCKKFKPQDKSRIRFIGNSMNGNVVAEPRAPLIAQCKVTLLIIYSHDGPLHEAAVIAFAELLKNSFGFDVHLDVWDMDEIERNLADYINSSIVKADKIIIVNSVGSFQRVQAKHSRVETVERISASPLDRIFNMQIDLALQHARVHSIRFTYSPTTATFFALKPILQYSVPENLGLLVASLSDSQMKNDSRLSGYSPELAKLNSAVERMLEYVEHEPNWFEILHHRLPVIVQQPQPLAFEPPLPISPIRSPGPVAIVATTPMSEGDTPLILEESEEEASPMTNGESIPDEPVESGFFSETIQTAEAEEIVPQVTDKPRIQILDPKDPRHAAQIEDSGILSDLNSGQIIA